MTNDVLSTMLNILLLTECIQLSVNNSLLLWTDWGRVAKIEQSYLDGTHRRVIVDTDLGLFFTSLCFIALYGRSYICHELSKLPV